MSNGTDCYRVQGFPLYANHSYFDPRRNGYTLSARSLDADSGTARKRKAKLRQREPGAELWRQSIPTTGKAMAMAGDVLFVAGEPMQFDDPSYKTYVAAYDGELGGRLLALSTADGTRLAEYKLHAAPAWDSIAIANGQLYISLADGTVQCFGQ